MEERIWHKSYPPGVPTSIKYEEVALPEALSRTAARFPEVTALILMGKKISYRELDGLVDRFAASLTRLGVKKGDKVAMVLPNIPQMVIGTYAVWRLGGVVVMNNPLYTERELAHQLNDSGSMMAICMDLLVPRMLSLRKQTGIDKIVSCHIRDYLPFPLKQLFPFVKKELHRKPQPGDEGVIEFLDLVREPAPKLKNESGYHDLAALLYTGGTTGVSKGVMLTQANLSVNVQQFKGLLQDMNEGAENVIGSLPFFHSAGFTAGMNTCIYRGFTCVLVPKPEVDVLIDVVKKYKPAIFGGVPTMFVGLLNSPRLPPKSELSFIKGCVSGAAPLAVETLREWEKRVGVQIVEVFGMTEMSPVSHANPWGGKCKAGSVGIPFPDTDCKIVDVETGENEMDQGQPGEILLKGPQMMQGYYKKPEESAVALKDGWFHTGDIGYMDEEGYLFVVDRKKDMIIASGFNIYPRDIDEVLFEHPKIQEACTIGLPDPYRGETVKVFVVVKAGQTMTEAEVIAYCKEKLAPYKVPKMVEFMDSLPKSVIGKVLRRELREMEMKKRAEK
jgi:long-chain acyl-CoA synthetase